MESAATLETVRQFWNAHPCGAHYIDAPFATPLFYRQYAAFRYRTEWHLNELVPFEGYRGKQVLEIGSGLGADGARFAHNGALYTGIDLTAAAVEATRLHFQTLGLPGQFFIQNAECMSDIAEAHFDLVYSHGVLHHTDNINKALGEVHRVLKPGGNILIMLYHRRSFNYYIRIQTVMRLQVLAYVALRSLLPEQRRAGNPELHYRNFARMGWRYLSLAEFPHHCADGPECPVAHSYTKAQVREIFAPYFQDLRFAVAHLPIRTRLPAVPLGVEGFLARRLGWYLFIYGSRR